MENNNLLADQLKEEILKGKQVPVLMMSARKGKINFFVRHYQLQKSMPEKEVNLLEPKSEDESLEEGIKYSLVKKIANLVSENIRLQDPLKQGHIEIHYIANPSGDELEAITLSIRPEVHHKRF